MSDSIDPTGILGVIQIRGLGDDALDPESEGLTEAISAHDRDRDAASLDLLRACVKPGRKLFEFRIAPLSPSALAYIASVDALSNRQILAFRAACVSVRDDEGKEHAPKITAGAGGKSDGTFALAPYGWYEQWFKTCGMDAVLEVAAVAILRSEVSPRATGFYSRLVGVRRLMR